MIPSDSSSYIGLNRLILLLLLRTHKGFILLPNTAGVACIIVNQVYDLSLFPSLYNIWYYTCPTFTDHDDDHLSPDEDYLPALI